MAEASTKPYLIRAIYDWCTDSGFTPYVAVAVDETVRVPAEFVNNGEIVLNVSALASSRLLIDNEAISFQARFGGVAREVYVPMAQVIAVYARENGQGMAFEVPRAMSAPAPRAGEVPAAAATAVEPAEPPKPAPERPRLTRIK
jgi:stringent starvation protein B